MALTKRKNSSSSSKKKKKSDNNGRVRQNKASATVTAARKKKIDALKRRLKIGKLKDLKRFPQVDRASNGEIKKAFFVKSGKTEIVAFEDSEGIKFSVIKLERGKEAEVEDTIRAVMDKLILDIDAKPVIQLSTALNDLTEFESLRGIMSKLSDDQLIGRVKTLDRAAAARQFLASKVPARDRNDPEESNLKDIADYFSQQSGDRSNRQYQQLQGELKTALDLEQSIKAKGDAATLEDVATLQKQIKEIQRRLPLAASTHRNAAVKENRNRALNNLDVLLDHHLATRRDKVQKSLQARVNDQVNRSNALPGTDLNSGSLESTGDDGGASGSYFHKDGKEIKGVYKPISQEGGPHENGFAAVREMVGYTADRVLQLGVVPTTAIVGMSSPQFGKFSGKKKPDDQSETQMGSYQKAVPNPKGDIGEYYAKKKADDKAETVDFDSDSLQRIAILDVLTLNADRQAENMLYDDAGRLHAIDQGEVSFGAQRFVHNFKYDNNADKSKWAWSELHAANQAFNQELRGRIGQMDVDQVVNQMKMASKAASESVSEFSGGDPQKVALSDAHTDMMRFSGRVLKMAVEAGLTPAQIETIFKRREESFAGSDTKLAKEAGGGEFASFLSDTFQKDEVNRMVAEQTNIPVPPRQFSFNDPATQAEFRKQLTAALKRLGVPDDKIKSMLDNNLGNRVIPVPQARQQQDKKGEPVYDKVPSLQDSERVYDRVPLLTDTQDASPTRANEESKAKTVASGESVSAQDTTNAPAVRESDPPTASQVESAIRIFRQLEANDPEALQEVLKSIK